MKKKINTMKNKKISYFVIFIVAIILSGLFWSEKTFALEVEIGCFKDLQGNSRGVCKENCDPADYVRFKDTCSEGSCCVKRNCTLLGGICRGTERPVGHLLYADGRNECLADSEFSGDWCYLPIEEEYKCKDGILDNKKANCTKGSTNEDCKKAFGESFFMFEIGTAPQLNCEDENGKGFICCASKEGPKIDKCKGKADGEPCSTDTINDGECKNEKCVEKAVEEVCKGICDNPCPAGYKHNSDGDAACGSSDMCCEKPGGATTESRFEYDNPLSVNSLTEWIYNLLGSIQGIVGWLAVIMIVLGGVVYILSGGSEKQTTLAKSIILWALVGFAIAVAAPALMKGIKDLIAGDGGGVSTDIIDNANSVKQIAANILTFLLGTIGALAVVSFAVGGMMYLFSGRDSNRADTAKRIILYSIIAIAVSGAGVILLRQVMSILEASA